MLSTPQKCCFLPLFTYDFGINIKHPIAFGGIRPPALEIHHYDLNSYLDLPLTHTYLTETTNSFSLDQELTKNSSAMYVECKVKLKDVNYVCLHAYDCS